MARKCAKCPPEHKTENRPGKSKLNVILLGNPNVGKSTIFNHLTGSNQKIVNSPGTTVTLETGGFEIFGETYTVVDMPGSYSLFSVSPDEEVVEEKISEEVNSALRIRALAAKGVFDSKEQQTAIVFFLDLSNLTHSLYFYAQIMDLGLPVILVTTKSDISRSNDINAQISGLSKILGREIIELNPRKKQGIEELKTRIFKQLNSNNPAANCSISIPDAVVEFQNIGGKEFAKKNFEKHSQFTQKTLSELAKLENNEGSSKAGFNQSFSDKIDRILLHPKFGIITFFVTMLAIFEATTLLANPLIELIDVNLRDLAAQGIEYFFVLINIGDTWIVDFVLNGVLNGIISTLVFIPPMGVLFLLLALLEDSGYLARTAFIADKMMRFIGLDGRSFLPLIVGFGCNLPSYEATRTLPDSRQRRLTAYLIPFTSCSARLVVYVLLSYIFFPNLAGIAMFLMYLFSTTFIIIVGLILKHTKNYRNLSHKPFILALPNYQKPLVKSILSSTGTKLWLFLIDAGKVIVSVTLIIWFLQAIPAPGKAGKFAEIENPQDSVYSAVCQKIAPVFAPAGFNDWRVSSSLVAGFVAKEVVIGALSQSFGVDDLTEIDLRSESNDKNLKTFETRMYNAFDQSSGGYPQLAGFAYMIFILSYTPCMAAVAEAKRVFGLNFAVKSIILGLIVAFSASTLIFQIGKLLWPI